MTAEARTGSASAPRTNSPTFIPPAGVTAACEGTPLARVGAVLRSMAEQREVTVHELRQHARDCGTLMEAAYERFQYGGDASGRREAMDWLARRNTALRMLQARGTSLTDDRDDPFTGSGA